MFQPFVDESQPAILETSADEVVCGRPSICDLGRVVRTG
jgi:hypothetical protein